MPPRKAHPRALHYLALALWLLTPNLFGCHRPPEKKTVTPPSSSAPLIQEPPSNPSVNDSPPSLDIEAPWDKSLRALVQSSLSRAVDAVLREERLQVSDLWTLRQFLRLHPHQALAEHVDRQAASTPATPFVVLVRHAPPPTLPDDPGHGIVRLSNLILASMAEPEDRALSFLREFLLSDESGYILTHQLLAVEWCEQVGRRLPKELADRRDAFLSRLAKEQALDPTFSDLFAERAALLLLHESPNKDHAAQWVRIILDAQQDDGTWGLLTWTTSYDGETREITGTRMHTATWAMLALAAYLDRFGKE